MGLKPLPRRTVSPMLDASLVSNVAVSATKPSFQVPVEWPINVADWFAQQAEESSRQVYEGRVVGYSTPSTADVGAASLRLQILSEEFAKLLPGSYAICLRRSSSCRWLPAIASIPGKHE